MKFKPLNWFVSVHQLIYFYGKPEYLQRMSFEKTGVEI